MTIEGWTQTLSAGPLLLIAALAIVVLLFLIITLRMHAFVALNFDQSTHCVCYRNPHRSDCQRHGR